MQRRAIYMGILCAPYISIDNELGDEEDVVHFPMPQGLFTPSISDIRITQCSNFRTYCVPVSQN